MEGAVRGGWGLLFLQMTFKLLPPPHPPALTPTGILTLMCKGGGGTVGQGLGPP